MKPTVKKILIGAAILAAGIILERKFGVTDSIPGVRNWFNG